MPLPMVHLAVAGEILNRRIRTSVPEFLLGSITPDAIHMRENTGKEDKHRVHLRSALESPDLSAIRTLLLQSRNEAPPRYSFTLGYVVHLLTDLHWYHTVYAPFLEKLPKGIARQELRGTYYQDTDQIDFNLYHSATWRKSFWDQLALAQVEDFHDLLSAQEIEGWRDRTLRWFGGIKGEPKIVPRYITDEMVARFIGDAARVVLARIGEWDSEMVPHIQAEGGHGIGGVDKHGH